MSASHRLNNKFKKDSAAILIIYQRHPVPGRSDHSFSSNICSWTHLIL